MRPVSRPSLALAAALVLATLAWGAPAHAQECARDVFLGDELAAQVDRAEALLQNDDAEAARPILEAVLSREVASSEGAAPAACSGRLLLALGQAYFALGRRQAALDTLERLAQLPTRRLLLKRGKALRARMQAQVQARFELPAWAAGAGTLTVEAGGRGVALRREETAWIAYVDPEQALEVTHTAELFHPSTRTLALPAPGPHRVEVDWISPVLLPLPDGVVGQGARAAAAARSAALAGDWGAAAAGFAEVREQARGPRVDYNLAQSEQRAGRPAIARQLYWSVENAAAPPWLKALAKLGRARLDRSLVRIAMQIPAGALVWVNGRSLRKLEDGSWALSETGAPTGERPSGDALLRVPLSARLRLEFDQRYRVAVGPGPVQQTARLELSPGPGALVELELSPLSSAGVSRVKDGGDGPSLLGPVLLGAGALGVGLLSLGAYLHADGLLDEARVDGGCTEAWRCERPDGMAAYRDAQRFADYATAGSVIAGVAGVAAAVWLVVGLRGQPDEAAVALRPSRGGATLGVAF